MSLDYCCCFENCSSRYTKLNSLRQHAKRSHDVLIKKERVDPDLIRKQSKLRMAKKRKLDEEKLVAACKTRPPFTMSDAKSRGNYNEISNTNHDNDLLQYKKSSLGTSTGAGVFAREYLKPGDYVTVVHGNTVRVEDTSFMKRTHLFRLSVTNKTVLLGIDVPVEGKGLGSFIQRGDASTKDATPCKRVCDTNCMFINIKGEIFIKITKHIKKDRELFMSYGQGVTVK